LYTADGETFKAYVNGTLLNDIPEANLSVTNVKQDTVKVKIEFTDGKSAENTLYLLEKGKKVTNKEFIYLLFKKDNQIQFKYTGTHQIIRLPDPLVPVKPVVDTSYKLRDNVLGHYCELKDGRPSYFNNIPATEECLVPMPESYMNYARFLFSRAQNEDDKYSVAENTCRNNCISVSQLNKILVTVPYEIEKLKLIKTCYFHITDKSAAKRLDSTFKLESSKKELGEFLKTADAGKLSTGGNCAVASAESKISEMCNSLAIYSNDSERLQFLKKVYQQECYSANQVKLVLTQFIHDREKLEAAKMLYFYCTEKNNFLTVTEVFSYNASAAELKDFVAKQKK
jgi:hypothetical protein